MKQVQVTCPVAVGDGPRPMVTMFVRPTAVLASDEIVHPSDKRYVVLSKLATHNGFARRAGSDVLVRRPSISR